MVSYWRSIITLSLGRAVFEILDLQVYCDLETQLGSLKVIGTDTYRSITYDFLLPFHSNHGPISYLFMINDNFSHPHVFNAPAEGVLLGIWYQCKGWKKTRMTGLPDGQKSFKICLAV